MSAFQDAPKPRIVRFIRGFTNFSVDPYYDPLSLVMIITNTEILPEQSHWSSKHTSLGETFLFMLKFYVCILSLAR